MPWFRDKSRSGNGAHHREAAQTRDKSHRQTCNCDGCPRCVTSRQADIRAGNTTTHAASPTVGRSLSPVLRGPVAPGSVRCGARLAIAVSDHDSRRRGRPGTVWHDKCQWHGIWPPGCGGRQSLLMNGRGDERVPGEPGLGAGGADISLWSPLGPAIHWCGAWKTARLVRWFSRVFQVVSRRRATDDGGGREAPRWVDWGMSGSLEPGRPHRARAGLCGLCGGIIPEIWHHSRLQPRYGPSAPLVAPSPKGGGARPRSQTSSRVDVRLSLILGGDVSCQCLRHMPPSPRRHEVAGIETGRHWPAGALGICSAPRKQCVLAVARTCLPRTVLLCSSFWMWCVVRPMRWTTRIAWPSGMLTRPVPYSGTA